MKATLIDTHTHIDGPDFDEDREEVIARARAAGVETMINIGASRDFDSATAAIALAEKYDFIYATVGVHPHDAELEYDADTLRSLAQHPKVVAVGETGLDFYRDWSPYDRQEEWFRIHISVARELRKPLVIHSRSASEECLKILEENNAQEIGGVFHCYPEDAAFARRAQAINFMVSFPGIVTFKNAKNVHEAVKDIPLEQIMVETDAPYLAPEPFRGKRCEPAQVIHTAQRIAELKGISFNELAAVTTQNARKLFRLP